MECYRDAAGLRTKLPVPSTVLTKPVYGFIRVYKKERQEGFDNLHAMGIIAKTTVELALLIVGSSLVLKGVKKNLLLCTTVAVVKPTVFPLLAFFIFRFISLSSDSVVVGTLMLVMPTAIVGHIMNKAMGKNETVSAHVTVVSHLLSAGVAFSNLKGILSVSEKLFSTWAICSIIGLFLVTRNAVADMRRIE